MNVHPGLRRLGRDIRKTLVAIGLYLGGLGFLAIIAFEFVPSLLKDVAATPATWIDVASDRATSGSRVDPAALPLHGSTEPHPGRRREPHMLPN